jgi:hypothetical protein
VTKPLRAGFVSYARDDAALVERFLAVMRPRCAVQRDVELQLWSDRAIVAGKRWEQEIGVALAAADFGLLCVSPSLLASSFVTTVELPALLRRERLAIPLALEPLDFDQVDLKGLEALQVFRLRRPEKPRGRSFDECRGVNAKRFCDELVGEIVQGLGAAGRLG